MYLHFWGVLKMLLKLTDVMIKNPEQRYYGYESRAFCLESMDKTDRAIEMYLKAAEEAPLHFEAAVSLAHLYSVKKTFDKSIETYEYAVKLKPYDTDVLYALQSTYRRAGRYKEAYNTVREILRIDPNHSGAHRVLPYLEENAR